MFDPNLPINRFPNACPCCGYATLDARGEYDICAICWWEDDTLVIDSVGYNEDFWFERMGLPHTEAVHITEYFKRVDAETVEYTFVMADPIAYETPVEGRLTLLWREGRELFEYICQQSNYAHDLMVNPVDLRAIGTSSPIVP